MREGVQKAYGVFLSSFTQGQKWELDVRRGSELRRRCEGPPQPFSEATRKSGAETHPWPMGQFNLHRTQHKAAQTPVMRSERHGSAMGQKEPLQSGQLVSLSTSSRSVILNSGCPLEPLRELLKMPRSAPRTSPDGIHASIFKMFPHGLLFLAIKK